MFYHGALVQVSPMGWWRLLMLSGFKNSHVLNLVHSINQK